MPRIKRYPNRKLYDTDARRYITLEEIAELVQRGEDVQVVDHASGVDLTALTLSQVVFELQKKQRGFLPRNFLAALIHAGATPVSSLASALGLNELVNAEIQRRIESLVATGTLTTEEGIRWLGTLISTGAGAEEATGLRPFAPPFTPLQIEQALERLPIPTRKDYLKLTEQLDQLEAALAQIQSGEQTPPEA